VFLPPEIIQSSQTGSSRVDKGTYRCLPVLVARLLADSSLTVTPLPRRSRPRAYCSPFRAAVRTLSPSGGGRTIDAMCVTPRAGRRA
jgi:hypothetical protein